MNANDASINAAVWRSLYAEGQADLQYPSEMLVRITRRVFKPEAIRTVLDYGCGTGANLLHLAKCGYHMSGVDISSEALAKTKQRLAQSGLSAELEEIEPARPLHYSSGAFDAVIAWQVLSYNNRESWLLAVGELYRVLKENGILLIATVAPGDISHRLSDEVEPGVYRSRVPGQEGCILYIPDEQQLRLSLPGWVVDLGEFGFHFRDGVSRHWLVISRKDAIRKTEQRNDHAQNVSGCSTS